MAKILILDIETKPTLAYVWRFFKENIGAKQVVENGEMFSWAAKWFGDDKVYYEDTQHFNEKSILQSLCSMLDDADIAIAHNAQRFDMPYIRGRCLVHGVAPPSPVRVIDTLKVAKREFKFNSNSLEHLGDVLGVKHKKLNHKKYPGFELWRGIMNNEAAAWEENKEYNIGDVLSLEDIYLAMRPFITNHPNIGVFAEHDHPVCPKCGSSSIQFRGYAYTNVGKYHRIRCNDCGGWARTRFNEYDKDKRKDLIINAV